MKKTKQFALALGALAILGGTNVFAQRSVDLEVSLDNPTYGYQFTNGDDVQVTVSLKNNGPDDLVAGDTIFYTIPYNQGASSYTVSLLSLKQGIPSGQSITLIDQKMGLTVSGPGGAPLTEQTTANLCIRIFNPNKDKLTDPQNNPVVVSYTDTKDDNNVSCATVVIDPAGGDNGGGDNGGAGIADVSTHEALNLYPNPARSTVNFKIGLQQTTDVTAVVRDITGRTVLQRSFGMVPAGNDVPLQINVSDFAPGMYIVELHAGDKQYIGKVNVQN